MNSPVLTWPEYKEVHQAALDWAKRLIQVQPEVLKVGYFGSYAENRYGVGSDLDLIVILKDSDVSPYQRILKHSPDDLPVPAEVLIYTQKEFADLLEKKNRFSQILEKVVWL